MELNILYATVSGNAEMVAKKLKKLALDDGIAVSLNELNYHTIQTFKKLNNVAIITSTYGDGDVPEMGAEFWEELKVSKSEMPDVSYGLIALGDRSHTNFCGAGKKISSKLELLKCKKIIDNLECDGDTEGTYEWSKSFLKNLKKDSIK